MYENLKKKKKNQPGCHDEIKTVKNESNHITNVSKNLTEGCGVNKELT